MNGPLKWHGGKHYLAPKIVALMPPHTHYVEPYFGGGAVLLAKDPDGVSEVVNDLNGDLINFWRVLQDEEKFRAFRRVLDAVPFAEEEYELADARINDPAIVHDPVRWACAFFVLCRQSLAGRMKDFAPLSRTRVRGRMNEQASAWLGAVEGLPAVHDRLKRVVILGPKDALEVMRQQDGPQTLFYLDPPYLHETRQSTDDYAHEMTIHQHHELCSVIRGCQGKVMLSGYRSALYQAQLECEGWRRHDFDLPNNAAGGASKRRMTESLWCNFGPQEVLS